ncbi:hypothetical protein, partial [Staphylococcus epidermidis]|uniref:hypothetical protein n=1 Tax=Staphylococcus epidermidis TaxID=1282 RepID=UPI001C92E7C3
NKVLGKNGDVNGIRRNKGEGEGMSNDLREGKNKLEVDSEGLEKIKREVEDEIDEGSKRDGMSED